MFVFLFYSLFIIFAYVIMQPSKKLTLVFFVPTYYNLQYDPVTPWKIARNFRPLTIRKYKEFGKSRRKCHPSASERRLCRCLIAIEVSLSRIAKNRNSSVNTTPRTPLPHMQHCVPGRYIRYRFVAWMMFFLLLLLIRRISFRKPPVNTSSVLPRAFLMICFCWIRCRCNRHQLAR